MNELHYQLDLMRAMNQKLSDREKMYRLLCDTMDYAYIYYSFEKNSVSSAYYVTFTCYVSGSDHVYTADRYLIKIKGKWYMGRGFTI